MKKTTVIRIFSLLLALAMCFTALTGCNSKNEDEELSDFNMGDFTVVGGDDTDKEDDGASADSSGGNSSVGTPTESKPTTPSGTTSLTAQQVLKNMPTPKEKTLKICFWEDLKNTSYGKAVEKFEKETGITVKPQLITKDTYDSEVAALIAGGNSPDMVLCITNKMSVIKNLQPITASGFNFNDTAWDAEGMKNFTFNGRTYAMLVKNSPKQNVSVLVYNKKALKKAEMEDPYSIWSSNPSAWTWNKLWSMCETFLTKNKNKEGYFGMNFGLEDTYLRCFNTGLYGYNPNTGKYENYTKTNEAVKRYTELKDKIDKKLVAAVSNTDSFIMGHTLFSSTFSSALEKRSTFFTQLGDNLGAVPFPTDSKASPGFEFCAWGIPVGSKNAMAVPYFVRFVLGPDLYDMNDFYKNEQYKKTVDEMLNRSKICYDSGWRYDIWNGIMSGTSSQVKTVLDSFSGTIDDTIALEMAEMKNLAK